MLSNEQNLVYSGFKAVLDVIIDMFTYSPTATILSTVLLLLAIYAVVNVNLN